MSDVMSEGTFAFMSENLSEMSADLSETKGLSLQHGQCRSVQKIEGKLLFSHMPYGKYLQNKHVLDRKTSKDRDNPSSLCPLRGDFCSGFHAASAEINLGCAARAEIYWGAPPPEIRTVQIV